MPRAARAATRRPAHDLDQDGPGQTAELARPLGQEYLARGQKLPHLRPRRRRGHRLDDDPHHDQIDVTGIVEACEHGLVFTKADTDHLIATAKTSWVGTKPGSLGLGMAVSVQPATGTAKAINACVPNSRTAAPASAGSGALSGQIVSAAWNVKADQGQIVVQPKDPTAAPVTLVMDKNTKVQVLRMWDALAPYDLEIQKNHEATLNPDGWGGLAGAPAYLMLQAKLTGK